MIAELVDYYAAKFKEKSKLSEISSVNELRSEYLSQVAALSNVEQEINEELTKMTSAPCRDNADLWILAAQIHLSDSYIKSLCEILANNNECIWHEGIVEIFQEMRNPEVVTCLERALNHELSYDPGKVVAIRILDTLADIGTVDAITIIKKCLNSPHIEIREVAEILMDEIQ